MRASHPISGVGIGLRHKHFQDILHQKPPVPWLEVHSENFFKPGNNACAWLETIRHDYPLSAHCVGLSLGSAQPVNQHHLNSLKLFIKRYQPALVSDHVSWSAVDNTYINDLLPLPYTEEALAALCRNIERVQEALRRPILIENPSSYLTFAESSIPEWEFFVSAAQRTGCLLLLDINNIYVSAHNHGFDAMRYLDAIPPELVKEIHLAGYTETKEEGQTVLIDTHGAPVYPQVWKLFENVSPRFAHAPALIEWDTDIPELPVLLNEAKKAEVILSRMQPKAIAS